MKALLCVLLALTIRLSAADLAGTWTGSLTVTGPGGRAESERCLATLRQHGSRITGSVGPDRSVQWKIRNGKLVGARVTFDVLPPREAGCGSTSGLPEISSKAAPTVKTAG
jgi:hypothetical protein